MVERPLSSRPQTAALLGDVATGPYSDRPIQETKGSEMAILMTAEVPGMTQEMVDGMTAQLEERQKAQPGFVVHVNGPIDGGWCVTEVWEAEKNWNSWYDGTIKPNLPEGMEPQITTREVHHIVRP